MAEPDAQDYIKRLVCEVERITEERMMLDEIIRAYDAMMVHGRDLRDGTHARALARSVEVARALIRSRA